MNDRHPTRRQILRRIAATALTATSLLAQDQAYPAKPIRVIAP